MRVCANPWIVASGVRRSCAARETRRGKEGSEDDIALYARGSAVLRKRKRLSVPERSRAMFVRCRMTTATAAPVAKMITGHVSPSNAAATGSEAAANIDANDA